MRPERLLAIAMLVIACSGGTGSDVAGPVPPPRDDRPRTYLTAESPSMTQPVVAIAQPRFVEVEVVEVVNPERLALSFTVHYEHAGERVHLGAFSLYPADNPGRFLVATRGLVRGGEGTVLLTMTAPEGLRAGVRVAAVVGFRD